MAEAERGEEEEDSGEEEPGVAAEVPREVVEVEGEIGGGGAAEEAGEGWGAEPK